MFLGAMAATSTRIRRWSILGLATEPPPGDRHQEGWFGYRAREKAFRMASGGEDGCKLARDPELHREILELLHTWIEGQDLSEKGIMDQLLLIRAILEAAGDPDREFLRRAEQGLPLGILEGLPRTPHVFEEQTS